MIPDGCDDRSPLNDPNYVPQHPPVNGTIPDVVRQWAKASQLRWFGRFRRELRTGQGCDGLWVSSEQHPGWCCSSCISEADDGYQGGGVIPMGYCCCHDPRI